MIFLWMGAAYGVSLLIDSMLFPGFEIAKASMGQICAKLGIHTALILAYIAAAWFTIRGGRKPLSSSEVAA
jgi:hypothetical protein